MIEEIEPVSAIKRQKRFAIGPGLPGNVQHRGLDLEVVVDFAIGDQGPTGVVVEGLIPGIEIDDGEPIMPKADPAGHIFARSVGAPMAECVAEGRQHPHGRRTLARHDAGDAAHEVSF